MRPWNPVAYNRRTRKAVSGNTKPPPRKRGRRPNPMQHLFSNLKLNRQQDGEPRRQSSPATSTPTTPEAPSRTRSRSLQDDLARSPRRTERYTPVTLAQAVELEQLMGGGTARDAERRLQRRQARAHGQGTGVELGMRDEQGVLWRSAAEREEHLGLLSNRIGHGRRAQKQDSDEGDRDDGESSSSSSGDQLEFPAIRRHPSAPALPIYHPPKRHGRSSLPTSSAREAFFADAFAPPSPRSSMQVASAPATPASASFSIPRLERPRSRSHLNRSPSLAELLAQPVPPNSPATPVTPSLALKPKQSLQRSFIAFAKKFKSRDTLQERIRQEKMGRSLP